MSVNINNPKLFSWYAGEDSEPEFLERCFYPGAHDELKQFFDDSSKFRVVISRKGVGKSTLLYANKIEKHNCKNTHSFFVQYDDLDTITINGDSRFTSIKDKISKYINLNVGRDLSFSLNSTNMELTESAIAHGSRKSGLLGSILEKFNFPIIGLTHRDKAEKSPLELLKNYMATSENSIWILIDDVDANFVNNEDCRKKIYDFLKACKELSMSMDRLFIRCSLRNNVWTTLRARYEALDKFDNFIFKLNWRNDDIVNILRSQTIAHFDGGSGVITGEFSDFSDLYKPYMNQVFESDFRWRGRYIEPYLPISYFSAGRPRWALKMCRESADLAIRYGKDRIDNRSFRGILRKFSQERILDICAENRHQCSDIESVIGILQGFPSEFSRKEFQSHVEKCVKSSGLIFEINEKPAKADEIVDFLYSIGLLIIRESQDSVKPCYFDFDQMPNAAIALDIYSDRYCYIVPLVFQEGLRTKKTKSHKNKYTNERSNG
ncbi:P-loop ATPase, Sll1717 family [Vibrio vulnificus]|uniref:P-loop ATPase, Sll1717 family n=1 Tax=Vibrio vulnificus TaxID=672 RepID=UPI003241F045